MALFFNKAWFEDRMAGAGLTKPDLARALGLSEAQLAEMWKDQREISDKEIKTMALLLGASEADVRLHGGVQGSPEARAMQGVAAQTAQDNSAIEARLTRIEATLEAILRELKSR